MSIRFLTAGESHGKALVGIIEGIPSGLELTAEDIHLQLRRRKLGFGRGERQLLETDRVEILSGVRHGKTLGGPIALCIENQDWKNWQEIMQVEPIDNTAARSTEKKVEVPRPGHADYVGGLKYQHEDMRNVLERASARETTMRVALGSVARKFLASFDIQICSRVICIGGVEDSAEMIEKIKEATEAGDTLGGIFEVTALNVPLGLGSYVQWDRRLEAEIGKAFLSLNAIKGVEIGLGFEAAQTPGSLAHDEWLPTVQKTEKQTTENRVRAHTLTNRSGGIEGGMSTGNPIVVRAAMKPLATLRSPLASVNLKSGVAASAHVERSDVCAVPSAAVIGESLLALVLANALLEKSGGDSMNEIIPRVQSWKTFT